MTDQRRFAVAIASALVLAVTLAGCVSIPSSGPASQGLAIDGSTSGTSFEVNPEGPAKGDTPSAILKGFVAAFQSSTGGYAVAREFLSSSFSTKWDPTQSVQVRSGDARLVPLDSSDIEYTFTTSATIDNTGAYKQTNQPSTLSFSFVKEGKEWRISSAPNGVVLSDLTFQRLFARHALYFLDPTGQNLVPDLRWFPNGTAPTRIVSALLAGPPAWQQGAVRTEFPDGTQLTDTGSLVTVVSGVAHVDLTAEALNATLHERQLMLVQLSDSLRSVATISSVSISVKGAPLVIDDLGSNGPQADAKVDGQALVLQKTEFGFYANGKVATIPQLSSKVVPLSPTAATLSSDGDSLAVLGSGGVSLVRRSAATPTLLDNRPELIAPSMDENGYVWSVPTDQPNAVTVYDTSGAAHSVATSLPTDARIVSLQVSRDGARIAILLATPTGPRLEVGAILRDQKLVPTGIGPLVVDAALPSGEATDLTWVDELTVAILVSVGAQSVVDEFVIGGEQSQLGDALPGAQAIVGGNGQQGLRVLGDDSLVYSYQGSSWQSSKVSVGFIATQR
ncbi:MAG: LpqB family beta-propeller domain-containing protein [Actinomycetota bacterium]